MEIPKQLKENSFFQELLESCNAYNVKRKVIELLNMKRIFPKTVIKNRLPVNKVEIKRDKIILYLN